MFRFSPKFFCGAKLVLGPKTSDVTFLMGPSAATHGHALLEVEGCICSLYLCVDTNSRSALLLDAGAATDCRLVQKVLTTLSENNPDGGPRPFQLAGCLSTHAHPDHMGSCFEWQKLGVPVVLSAGALNWYSGFGGAFQYALDFVLGTMVRWRQGNRFKSILFRLPNRDAPNTAVLVDMAPLPFGLHRFGWVPVYSPGHTDHMFTIYNPNGKAIYVADLVVMPKTTIRPPIPIEVPQAYLDTLDRLERDFEVDYMLLPHGGVVRTADHGGWTHILQGIRKRAQTEKVFARDWLCGWNSCLKR